MKTREEKITEFLNTPIKVGDRVNIKGLHYKKEKVESHVIHSLRPLTVKEYGFNEPTKFTKDQIVSRDIRHIGENPFPEYKECVRMVSFTLYSIIHAIGYDRDSDRVEGRKEHFGGVDVAELNWNPYVMTNHGKEYYQREFVWDLKDKQLLLESIYNRVDCGKIIIRKRSWDYVEKEVANGNHEVGFKDVVDGKQRLNAILGFVNNEYPDMRGNYYRDFSEIAQHHFLDHQLFAYGEMPESSTDEDVIRTFLMINHTGKSQSEEHINFVKSLL